MILNNYTRYMSRCVGGYMYCIRRDVYAFSTSLMAFSIRHYQNIINWKNRQNVQRIKSYSFIILRNGMKTLNVFWIVLNETRVQSSRYFQYQINWIILQTAQLSTYLREQMMDTKEIQTNPHRRFTFFSSFLAPWKLKGRL